MSFANDSCRTGREILLLLCIVVYVFVLFALFVLLYFGRKEIMKGEEEEMKKKTEKKKKKIKKKRDQIKKPDFNTIYFKKRTNVSHIHQIRILTSLRLENKMQYS